jgi:hypothetical protein
LVLLLVLAAAVALSGVWTVQDSLTSNVTCMEAGAFAGSVGQQRQENCTTARL